MNAELRAHFRPGILEPSRRYQCVFKPLTLDEIEQIVDLLVAGLSERLSERNLTLHLAEDARRFVAEQGFDPVFGARPLKRYLQRELETKVGRALLSGEVIEGSTIEVSVADGELNVKVVPQGELAA